jgi:glutamate/tyrosine decarboxylase-like PLP-dependent enzyme
MDDDAALLHRVADEATSYLSTVSSRPVGAAAATATLARPLATRLPQRLPERPLSASAVLDELLSTVEDGLVASGSPRFFGFVIGSALPVAIAADWLTSTWDQNAGMYTIGPAAAVIEETVGAWLLDLLELPPTSSFAVVTGCQMAHVTCLAAARHHLLARQGWDVERDGMAGSPPIRVIGGALAHVTIPRALRLLGFGSAALELVDVDEHGRMDPTALARALDGDDRPAIVCAQLGEVNTGAMDPIDELADITHAAGGWLHVDGAFGLWARTAEGRRHLADGVERADSWATDAHKWLNVPYDAGLAFCAHPEDHRLALSAHADYLAPTPGQRDAVDWTPEFSRRARGIAIYAALRWFGRAGVGHLVDRCCDLAQRFATGLESMGADVLNDVVLNQVLVSFGNDERTRAVMAHLQQGGEAWMSGTTWDGQAAMRISVVGFRPTVEDVDRTLVALGEAMDATAHLTTPHTTAHPNTAHQTTAHLHEGGQLAS